MSIFDLLVILVQCVWAVSEFTIFQKMRSAEENADRVSYKALYAIVICGLFIGISIGNYLKFVSPIGLYSASAVFPILGIVFMLIGMAVRFTAIHQLKQFFTVNVAIRSDHQLITDGWYRILRHPAYLGGILTFVGCGLSYGNILSVLVISLPYLVLILKRIKIEEALLEQKFGNAYLEMKRKTKKLIPYLY